MKNIFSNIQAYITKWWVEVDKQFLFWGVLAAILVALSIYQNT